jgi:hypothetical protein
MQAVFQGSGIPPSLSDSPSSLLPLGGNDDLLMYGNEAGSSMSSISSMSFSSIHELVEKGGADPVCYISCVFGSFFCVCKLTIVHVRYSCLLGLPVIVVHVHVCAVLRCAPVQGLQSGRLCESYNHSVIISNRGRAAQCFSVNCCSSIREYRIDKIMQAVKNHSPH